MCNKNCVIKYLKITFKLHLAIGQKLQRTFFLIFTESKPTELILHLKHLNEYRISSNKHLQRLFNYKTFRCVAN